MKVLVVCKEFEMKRDPFGFKRFLKTLSSDQSGTAVIELAVTLPFVLILLLAIADFSLFIYRNNELENAVRLGGQVALLNPSDLSGVAQTVKDATISIIDSVNVVGPFCTCADGAPTNFDDISGCADPDHRALMFVNIEAIATYDPIFLNKRLFGPGGKFSREAVFRVK